MGLCMGKMTRTSDCIYINISQSCWLAFYKTYISQFSDELLLVLLLQTFTMDSGDPTQYQNGLSYERKHTSSFFFAIWILTQYFASCKLSICLAGMNLNGHTPFHILCQAFPPISNNLLLFILQTILDYIVAFYI